MKSVRVIWLDSVTLTGWNSKEKVDKFFKKGPDLMESTGYLYKKSKKSLVIVQSIHAYKNGSNFSEALMIPKECVIDIKELKDG